MKQEYQLLHYNMLQDVERCMQLALPEAEKAESCFWIVKTYWEKLKEHITDNAFKDDNDEIKFFWNVKPQFTCYIEYFVLLSEALLFEPVKSSSTQTLKRFILTSFFPFLLTKT